MFREIQESFHQLDGETQKAEMGQYTAHHQLDLLDYIYDHFDVFRLLLDGAHGTRFSCFWTSWWTLRWSTPTSTWRSSAARA